MKYYVILYALLSTGIVLANNDPEDALPTDGVSYDDQTATTSCGGFDDPSAALSSYKIHSIHDIVRQTTREERDKILVNVPSADFIMETIKREEAEEAVFPLDSHTEAKAEEQDKPTLPSAVDITIDIFSLDTSPFYVDVQEGETIHTTVFITPNRAVYVKSGSIALWKAENDNESCVFLDLFTKGGNELLALTIINDRTSETKTLYCKYDPNNKWAQVTSQLYQKLWDELGFTLDNAKNVVDYSDEYLKFPLSNGRNGRFRARRVNRFLRMKPVLDVTKSGENETYALINGYYGGNLPRNDEEDDEEDDEKSSLKKTRYLVGDLDDSKVVEYTPSRLSDTGSFKSISDLDDPEVTEEVSTE